MIQCSKCGNTAPPIEITCFIISHRHVTIQKTILFIGDNTAWTPLN